MKPNEASPLNKEKIVSTCLSSYIDATRSHAAWEDIHEVLLMALDRGITLEALWASCKGKGYVRAGRDGSKDWLSFTPGGAVAMIHTLSRA